MLPTLIEQGVRQRSTETLDHRRQHKAPSATLPNAAIGQGLRLDHPRNRLPSLYHLIRNSVTPSARRTPYTCIAQCQSETELAHSCGPAEPERCSHALELAYRGVAGQ